MPIITTGPSTTDQSAAPAGPSVAFFPHARAVRPYSHILLPEFYRHVQVGVWAKLVAHVRALREQVDASADPAARETAERAWSAAKAQLPAVTLSADGQTRERSVPLIERGLVPSGRMQIDLDLHGEPADERERLRRLLTASDHIEAVWRSPSGDGLKATVRIAGAGDPTQHADCFATVDRWLLATIGRANDPSVKDPQRLCFVSHDPELYVNLAAVELVEVAACHVLPTTVSADHSLAETPTPTTATPVASPSASSAPIPQGSRNDLLFRLGCGMRGRGMSREAIAAALPAENLARCVPPLASEEVDAVVQSVSSYETGQALAFLDFSGVIPEPLPAGLPPVPTLDPALLPDAFRPFIVDVAERMQAPADFAAVAVMVAAGSVLGTRCCLRPKHYDDWTVVPNLWGAVVGRPSTLKSPAIAEPVRLLQRLEIQAKEFHDTEQQAWDQRQRAQTIIAKQTDVMAGRKARQALERQDDPLAAVAAMMGVDPAADSAPVRRRFITNDATVEKLGELLAENPHGVLCFRDELTGWLKAMDRDGHEQDRAFHLESFNGTGRFAFDRVGRGTIEIEHAVQSVLGGIQPGPFQDYLATAAQGGSGDDGLVQRFQVLSWPDQLEEFTLIDRRPDVAARDAAQQSFERLAGLDAASIGAEEDRGWWFLRFRTEAQTVWNAWYTAHMTRLRQAEMPAILAAHLGKQAKTCPALALIIHLVDGGHGPVSVSALERAIGWCTYLEAHARRAYHGATASDIQAARVLGVHVRAGEVRDGFTLKDLYRHDWSRLGDRTACAAAVAVLVDLGWLILEPRAAKPGPGRPPAERWWINPLVFTGVAALAESAVSHG